MQRLKHVTMVLTLVLVAAAAAQGEPRYGGTLRIIPGAEIVNMSGAFEGNVPNGAILKHIHDTLIEMVDGLFVPSLATSWSTSQDGLIWTFQLRDDVLFHDGTPFTAYAVKRTYDRYLDSSLGLPRSPNYSNIASVNVVDDYTVEFHTRERSGAFLGLLAWYPSMIIHPTQTEEELLSRPLGTGPYRLVSWERGDRLTMTRFEEYWGERPYLDELIFIDVTDAAVAVLMLEAGEVDVVLAAPVSELPRLGQDPRFTVDVRESSRTMFLKYILYKEPFDDLRVRQAIHHAIDINAITQGLFQGVATPTTSIQPPGVTGAVEFADYHVYDPERARQLLAEAGYPNGFDATLHFGAGRYLLDSELAQALQAYLGAVGIHVTLRPIDWESFRTMQGQPRGDNELELFFWSASSPTDDIQHTADRFFHSMNQPPGCCDVGFYANPEFERLLDAARAETDVDLRLQYLADAQAILNADRGVINLFTYNQTSVWRSTVHGIDLRSNSVFRLATTWREN